MNIEEKLTTSIISAIKTLYGQDVPGKMVQLQKTKKEFEGHLTLVVFPFLKMSKKGPEQTVTGNRRIPERACSRIGFSLQCSERAFLI